MPDYEFECTKCSKVFTDHETFAEHDKHPPGEMPRVRQHRGPPAGGPGGSQDFEEVLILECQALGNPNVGEDCGPRRGRRRARASVASSPKIKAEVGSGIGLGIVGIDGDDGSLKKRTSVPESFTMAFAKFP